MFKHDCKAADEKMCECFPVASACGLVLKLPVQHGEALRIHRKFVKCKVAERRLFKKEKG